MSETTMASVVAQPESEPSPSSNGLKRRQSETSEQENKRQRTSPGKNSPHIAPEDSLNDSPVTEQHTSKPDLARSNVPEKRRKSSAVVDEKQRSKRLFGSLLGNLNYTGGDRTSKRRQEIEARRKAELRKQDDELLEGRQRLLEAQAKRREKAQRRINEENMRIRHRNLLHTANFLQTTAEPRLYYRPWDLRPEEEERIENQVKEAQAQIDRELAQFEAQLSEDPKFVDNSTENNAATAKSHGADLAIGVAPIEDAASREVVSGEQQAECTNTEADNQPAGVSEHDATNTDAQPAPAADDAAAEHDSDVVEEPQKEDVEDDGHVVEGDEDTVIY